MADEPIAAYAEPITAKLGRWALRHKPALAATVVALGVSSVVLSLAAISQVRINERLARANREAGDRLIRLELARADSLWRRDPRRALDILISDAESLPESKPEFLMVGFAWFANEIAGKSPYPASGCRLESVAIRSFWKDAGHQRPWNFSSGRWCRKTRNLVRVLDDHTAAPHKLVFSADGRRLAVAFGGFVALWDMKTFAKILQFRAIEDEKKGVLDLALSPDGKLIGTAGQDPRDRLLQANRGNPVR